MLHIRRADGSDRWPSTPLAAALSSATASCGCVLFQQRTDFRMKLVATFSEMTWLIAVVAHSFPSLCHSVHPSHGRRSRGSCGCTLPSEMAPAGIAMLIQVLAVLVVLAVAISQTRHDLIDGGAGQHWSQIGQSLSLFNNSSTKCLSCTVSPNAIN